MQKRANRILSMLLVLVMVLTMLPATALADSESALKGWNLILGDDIGVKFTLNSADYTVITTVNGAEVTPTISGETVTVNVAAAQMTDIIGLTVKNGEETVHTGEYSVRKYADTILNGSYDAEVKDMVKQMLNYGAAAQVYFNHNNEEGKLANDGITVDAAAVPTDVPTITVEDNLADISLYGASLVFQNKVAVRFYFNVTGDINSFSFSQGTPVEKEGRYYVEIAGINPQNLADEVALSVNDGALSVSYSPLNYITRMYNKADSSAALKALVQAMYGYHLEAVDYQKYEQIVKIDTLVEHPDSNNNWTSSGIYMATQEPNDAPYNTDWTLEYAPTSSSVIKRIRNGETIDVAIANRGTIVKYDTDKYYLNVNSWTMGENAPAMDGDIYIIEGDFYNAANDATIRFAKNYIYLNGTNAEFSKEMPTLPTVIEGGMLEEVSGYGWTGATGDLIFKMSNDAPNGTYAPTSAANVKLIRNGETFDVGYVGVGVIEKSNATWYTLKFWTIVEKKPMQANDILVIEGEFYQESSKTTLNISKTYVLLNADNSASFSAEMPTLATVIDAGVMSKHSNGWNADALYFTMAENEAPAADAIRYKPESASNIKLIRDGVTYDVGHNLRETIVKASATGYYIALWTLGDYKPLKANDILIVEGNFTNDANNTTLNISKTYVLIKGDGTAEFSTEMPDLGTYVDGGLLIGNENGWTGDSIYFSMNENEAPYNTDWSLRYKPASSAVIKLLRDGTTTNIANKDAETLVKYSETDCAIATWMFGSYGLKAGDILIVEGEFLYAAENVTLNVQKSYILLNADGSVTISATEPVPATEVDCGVMSEHADGSASEIYFSMAANSIPVDEEALYPYEGTVQLVKGTAVSSVNVNIYKLDADMYYLELDGAELTDGSYLIVEGDFANDDNGYIMNISKTYVLADGDALVYSETEPVLETEYALTGLTNHPNGWNADGIYITHDAHEATIGTDWSVRYRPVSAEVIKLVRGGETFNIGQPAGDTLVVYGNTNMYFETKAWTTQGGKLPFVDGDQIIIEGKFRHEASGDILVAEKTVICVSGSNLIFNPIEGSNLGDHSNGLNGNGEGIYATMEANAAPYDGWSIEYAPLTENAYYVIRGGEQINIGMPGRGTLVKYGDTNYYLKMNSWCTNNFAYTTDDIFVIEGFWKQNTQGSAIMKIEKTYLYYNGSAWVFSATEPVPEVPGSMMQPYSENKWSSTDASNPGNLWFGLDGNDAATGAYRPTAEANVKLIRNGETYVVGHTARDTINKINDTWYVLEFWTIADYKPMLANDILIIEGDFYQASTDTTLRIEKTYVLLNADGTASYFDSEPSIGPETNHGVMNVTNWQKPASNPDGSANDGGLYFTLAENDVIYTTDWATQYKPVSTDVIKLIRGGVETNVANTGAGMIIKYSATEYYLQFWPISLKPMQAGDMMIVEGMFKNESNGSVLNIAKTYIVFNENGTVSVYENSPMSIDAGTMSAYAVQNWFDTNYNALYFVLSSNIAPANTDWSVRYTPKDAANIKLIRGGNTVNIANIYAETIVKIEDGLYALALDNWWWNAYAPIQDGDILIIEGEFSNASNGYTLNIDKTYITFVSKANDEVNFSTVSDTEFGEVVLPNSGDTLNIGLWNGSYHVFEDKQLKQLQDAGITKIMGIDTQWIGTTDVEGWLDRVYSYGIRVIIDLRSWDGETVPSYVNHPALIGFILYDEPCATDFDNLAALKAKFDAVMPEDLLFFVNLYGSSAAGTALMGTVDWALGRRDYDEYYVQRFLDKVGVEVLSWDSYALLEGSGIRTGYFYNFDVMASKDMPTWYTMLSAGHNTTATYYTVPTAEELRWQMAVAMTYGISNIDHYTYVSHEDDYSCMVEYDTWEPTDLYYDIKDVDNEYLAWDNIYMAYDWVGVGTYDAGNTNEMFSNLKNALDWKNYGVSGIQASEDLLVGVFDYNGENAYMITNAGTPGSATVGDGKEYITNDTTVTLTLDAADYKCAAIIDNGEISYVAVNNNTVTLTVEAYEGVFVIPVLN